MTCPCALGRERCNCGLYGLSPEMIALRAACGSEELAALRQRNEQRAAEAREQLAERWVFHKSNRVQPTDGPRGALFSRSLLTGSAP